MLSVLLLSHYRDHRGAGDKPMKPQQSVTPLFSASYPLGALLQYNQASSLICVGLGLLWPRIEKSILKVLLWIWVHSSVHGLLVEICLKVFAISSSSMWFWLTSIAARSLVHPPWLPVFVAIYHYTTESAETAGDVVYLRRQSDGG